MSTAIALKPDTISRNQSNNITANSLLPQPAVRHCYFENSEFYQIRGGFEAEVIKNPFIQVMNKIGIMRKIVGDLKQITLAAFEKTREQAEIYTPLKMMMKNVIMVDWLTIIRKKEKIIAYTSSSFIKQDILYMNATMVDPSNQPQGCVGILGHLYIWKKILEQRNDLNSDSLHIVTRTRNRDGVNILSHVLKEFCISGEDDVSSKYNDIFSKTGMVLGNDYDSMTGINNNVYPIDLPSGSDRNERINQLFLKLGPCDAFFMGGKIEYSKIIRYIGRELFKQEQNDKAESSKVYANT